MSDKVKHTIEICDNSGYAGSAYKTDNDTIVLEMNMQTAVELFTLLEVHRSNHTDVVYGLLEDMLEVE